MGQDHRRGKLIEFYRRCLGDRRPTVPRLAPASISGESWASYRRAVVDFAPTGRTSFRLIPDVLGATGTWPDDLAAPVVIVTAWNPGNIVRSADDNQARNRRLVAELDLPGITFWPAVGRDLDTPHHEVGVAVSGLTLADGLALGARHGQVAVFVWTPDAWAVISCKDDRCQTSGWRLQELPSPASPESL